MERTNPNLRIEAEMLSRAKVAVFESADWLTADQVASMAGFSESAKPREWERDGVIFAIRHDGVDYFPSYALDPAQEYRPYRAIKTAIEQFERAKDGWGLAFWFQSINSFLGGKRPMDLLAEKPDQVIAAAADEAAGVNHA